MKLSDALRVAIGVTRVYEGGGVTWDFDGAGVSLGLLQWNIKAKTLQPMLSAILESEDGHKLFPGTEYESLKTMLASSFDVQMEWVKGINDYENKAIKEPWLTAFKAMMATETWKALEAKHTKTYADIAVADTKWSGVNSVRSYCVFFDTAVQCGGMGSALKLALSAAKPFLLQASKDGKFKNTENDKAWLIACAGSRALISYMSNPAFAMNVFKRKLGLAEGGYNWRRGELPQVNAEINFESSKYGVSDEALEDL